MDLFTFAKHMVISITLSVLLCVTGFFVVASMLFNIPLQTCLFSIAVVSLVLLVFDVVLLTVVVLLEEKLG